MAALRRTALVQFELPSSATAETLPLTCERSFGTYLTIDGKLTPAAGFRSPINDELWREFTRQLRACNVDRSVQTGYHGAEFIRSLSRDLYQALAALSPELRRFLDDAGAPRRLVIQTSRPELHVLPWAALYDLGGSLLASGDLSIVQCWAGFSEAPLLTAGSLNLVSVLGADTNKTTALPLRTLPAEILRDPSGPADILHMEEHGNAVLGSIGKATAPALGRHFAEAKLALLWSCYSSAANSWGESPALCLHRLGAALVLSFQAELHYQDAKSIAQAFYADVFGPAASRDPESALVRIRATKFQKEFEYANWASMTVFLRQPLDLSALPLNGPRVPAAAWLEPGTPPPPLPSPSVSAAAASWPSLSSSLPGAAAPFSGGAAPSPELAAPWSRIEQAVRRLVPGTICVLPPDPPPDLRQPATPAWSGKLPQAALSTWRGNVIRLDGAIDPLADTTLSELNLERPRTRLPGPADTLAWFFARIANFGSPLIVWTNAAPCHREFLDAIRPASALTFLLLYDHPATHSIAELVDLNDLPQARAACEQRHLFDTPGPIVTSDSGDTRDHDEELSAAYFAFARSEMPERAGDCIARLADPVEALLLRANFVSRFCRLPGPKQDQDQASLSEIEQQQVQEDLYRAAIVAAQGENALTQAGRAKHQLGYLMHTQRRLGAALALYTAALADLERSPAPATRDAARYSSQDLTIGMVLRDWADLLAADPASGPEQLAAASSMLKRSLALHTFHDRPLEIAYSLTTSARLARAAGLTDAAINFALDAANRFEQCSNWRGWSVAFVLLVELFLLSHQPGRALALIDLAPARLDQSNLKPAQRQRVERTLLAHQARAHWSLGDLVQTRKALLGLASGPEASGDHELDLEIERIRRFLAGT